MQLQQQKNLRQSMRILLEALAHQENQQQNQPCETGAFPVVVVIFVAHYLPAALASECSCT